MSVIRVEGYSWPKHIADAIGAEYRDTGTVYIQAIDPKAVHQAIKAIIIAKKQLAKEGEKIVFNPSFVVVDAKGIKQTAVRLFIEGVQQAIPTS